MKKATVGSRQPWEIEDAAGTAKTKDKDAMPRDSSFSFVRWL